MNKKIIKFKLYLIALVYFLININIYIILSSESAPSNQLSIEQQKLQQKHFDKLTDDLELSYFAQIKLTSYPTEQSKLPYKQLINIYNFDERYWIFYDSSTMNARYLREQFTYVFDYLQMVHKNITNITDIDQNDRNLILEIIKILHNYELSNTTEITDVTWILDLRSYELMLSHLNTFSIKKNNQSLTVDKNIDDKILTDLLAILLKDKKIFINSLINAMSNLIMIGICNLQQPTENLIIDDNLSIKKPSNKSFSIKKSNSDHDLLSNNRSLLTAMDSNERIYKQEDLKQDKLIKQALINYNKNKEILSFKINVSQKDSGIVLIKPKPLTINDLFNDYITYLKTITSQSQFTHNNIITVEQYFSTLLSKLSDHDKLIYEKIINQQKNSNQNPLEEKVHLSRLHSEIIELRYKNIFLDRKNKELTKDNFDIGHITISFGILILGIFIGIMIMIMHKKTSLSLSNKKKANNNKQSNIDHQYFTNNQEEKDLKQLNAENQNQSNINNDQQIINQEQEKSVKPLNLNAENQNQSNINNDQQIINQEQENSVKPLKSYSKYIKVVSKIIRNKYVKVAIKIIRKLFIDG